MKKKITALVRKIQSSVTVNMNKRPLVTTLIFLFLINLVILFISAGIAHAIAPEFYPTFVDALCKGSIKWLFSTHALNTLPNAGWSLYLTAAITVITGLVLFTGTILAMTTNGLKEYFSKKSKAKGKLILDDHIVILNWNSKVPEILVDLMYKQQTQTVLVLSDKDKDFVKTQINNVLSKEHNTKEIGKINLVVRQGDPFSRSELDDISIATCRSVAIMAIEEKTEKAEKMAINGTDLNALRLLLAVGGSTNKMCNIVVEADTYESVKTLRDLASSIDSLKKLNVSVISFNRKLGQFLAQTVMQPSLFDVLSDLLSFKGDEFYSTSKTSIEEYLANYTNSIPIINYNQLYVLSDHNDNVRIKRDKPYISTRRLLLSTEIENEDKLSLFIIGENNRTPYMLENLQRSEQIDALKVYTFAKDDNDGLIKAISKTQGNKEILILSDDGVSQTYYDSNVFMSLIALKKGLQEDVPVIAEILDSKNFECMKDFKVNNTIVSNKLISLLITQLLDNKYSQEFFENLLLLDNETDHCIDVIISPLKEILDIKQDLLFNSYTELVNSFYYSTGKTKMLIAYKRKGKLVFLDTKMDEKKVLQLLPDDELVYIKY